MRYSSTFSFVLAICITTLSTVHAHPPDHTPNRMSQQTNEIMKQEQFKQWQREVTRQPYKPPQRQHNGRFTKPVTPEKIVFTEKQELQFEDLKRAYEEDRERDSYLQGHIHNEKISFTFGTWRYDLTGYDKDIVAVFRLLDWAGPPQWRSRFNVPNKNTGMSNLENSLKIIERDH